MNLEYTCISVTIMQTEVFISNKTNVSLKTNLTIEESLTLFRNIHNNLQTEKDPNDNYSLLGWLRYQG